jgi:hypothetical protein
MLSLLLDSVLLRIVLSLMLQLKSLLRSTAHLLGKLTVEDQLLGRGHWGLQVGLSPIVVVWAIV